MSRYEILQAFFAYEICDVEFVELMLADGASMLQIEDCLRERAAEDECDDW
jgi:hypothetical protein